MAEKMKKRESFAFDRATVRRTDKDGRLHVEITNISKANVCPYLGNEIPDWETLGLDGDRIYKLFRAPEELEKAAETFNNVPLLAKHIPVSAQDHQPDLVVGSTGTDARFEDPYLKNSIVIWAADAIDDVENDRKKELSCGYRYRADMTPGTYQGERYDGVMRDIVANHVALVKEGRAGPDVVVGDEKKDFSNMKKRVLSRTAAMTQGALIAYLKPMLAADAKIDFGPLVNGVTAKSLKARKTEIAENVKKLAQDADIGDLVSLLDAVGSSAEATDADEPALEANPLVPDLADNNDPSAVDPADALDDDPMAKVIEFLQGKLSPEDLAALQAIVGGGDKPADPAAAAADPVDPAPPAEAAADADPVDPADKDKDMITKPAMDAAIKTAVADANKLQRGIRDAERAVRPYIGEIAIACDSAATVYRHALKALGVTGVDTIHESALPTLLAMQPLPGAQKSTKPVHAMDAASAKGFAERFPDASRIKVI